VSGHGRSRDDDFPALTALRAVGAIAVVATHVGFQTGRTITGPFAPTLARLDVGVAIFFVLSGFLLGRQWLAGFQARDQAGGRGLSLRGYSWRRALRILPAYWLVAATCLLLLPQNSGAGALDWLRHLTLTQVYGAGWQRHGLTQTWSLCTEVAFYLLLPVLAVLIHRAGPATPARAAQVLLVGVVASTAWLVAVGGGGGPDVRVAGQWLPSYLSWFAAGLALALLSLWADRTRAARPGRPVLLDELARAPGTWWLLSLGAFLAATTPLAGPRSLESVPTTGDLMAKNLLYLVVATCLVAPFVFQPRVPGALGKLLTTRPAIWLGEISYGVFLWHLLVLEIAVRLMGQRLFTGSFLVTFAVTLTATVVVAAASYRLVELPAQRLRHRVPRFRRSTASVAPAITHEPSTAATERATSDPMTAPSPG
jgi:peptidoglycan/LPS O-acetylase OafA/YrhL